MTWFDAGVNLLDSRFDPAEVIESAVAAGVEKMCVICTHPNEWDSAKALFETYPRHIVYTLGVHPHNAKVVDTGTLDELPERLTCPGAIAVGECGLDFNRDFSPRDKQIDVFEQQLQIAKAESMPLYLHERDAHEQQLRCIESVYGEENMYGIAHCFTGDTYQMKAYLKKGLYIGVTGWLCDEARGQALRDAVKVLPLNRLILETDAPYLFPKTFRPRKRNNMPALIPHIAEELAKLVDQPLYEIEKFSYTNAITLFRIAKD
ncbi:TatD family deoxyribonuclease [Alteromonas sediminis]|uniref:TatD family deoxyribonuclease n=1 Tax=Alteromonas sediminis TaxID=2259342 RepID=A0A3N5ZAA2_9ALTE|nr:TatD family hydrolase [Alteromonas sediminis]RPJ66328.1 TatD family deoxyribonuclease [Alteromonas sediminis]